MTSVFSTIKQRIADYSGKRTADQLIQFQSYECFKFTQRKSDYPDKKTQECPMTLVAYIKDYEVPSKKYYLTLPSLYNNLSTDNLNELNDLIEKKKPPFVVFYGKDGPRNDLVLHQHGEALDKTKIEMYRKQEKEAEQPPSKK